MPQNFSPPLLCHNPSAVPENVCSEFFETVSRDGSRVFVLTLFRDFVEGVFFWGKIFWLSQVCLHFTFLGAAKLPCVLLAVYF